MGVYIKDMEMPKSCWDCEVGGAKQMDNATCPFYSMEYWEQENYQDKIADGCPLVPVPPHGRLGDLDELYAHLTEWYLTNRNGLLPTEAMYIRAMLFGIKDAPTIIEEER